VNVIGLAFSLVPQLLFVLVLVIGLVLVAQRGRGQPWARFALLGLGLMVVGSLVSLLVLGGLGTGRLSPIRIGPLYWLSGLLSQLLHWAGIGLLLAAALSGRRGRASGGQLPE
jgi:hypothetical protein